MLFVSGTTPGGTGSGGIPVGIEILSDLNKRIGVITTLPEEQESPKAHMNALECFSELSQVEHLGSVFSIDNEKSKHIFDDGDKSKIYHTANKQIIDHLFEVGSLCSQTSLLSNFDKNDLLGILEERGSSVISKITVPIEEIKQPSDIAEVINKSFSQYCGPDVSKGQIVKAAIIGKLPPNLISLVDVKLIFQNIGTPYDIVEAYYSNEEHQNHCIFYVILSGLSFPLERLKKMEQNVSSVEQDLINRVEVSRNQKFETGNWTNKFKNSKETPNKTSLAERLSKFK
ncbi:Tubulin-like protein CetZ [compost metagenome]